MTKRIITLKHGKHKGRTYYATARTFEILEVIGCALFWAGLVALCVVIAGIRI